MENWISPLDSQPSAPFHPPITTECLKLRGEWSKSQESALQALMGTEGFKPRV